MGTIQLFHNGEYTYKTMDALDNTSGVISPSTYIPKNNPDLYNADLLVEKAVIDCKGYKINISADDSNLLKK